MKQRRIVWALVALLGVADAVIGLALWQAWNERHPDLSARVSEPTPGTSTH
jgi:hypothetical protein